MRPSMQRRPFGFLIVPMPTAKVKLLAKKVKKQKSSVSKTERSKSLGLMTSNLKILQNMS